MMKRVRVAGVFALLLVAGATPEAWPQNARVTAPQTRAQERPLAPFAADIACEIAPPPNSTAMNLRHLYARNTLPHRLPAGTRLSWSYRQFGLLTSHQVTGARVLGEPVPAQERTSTGVNLSGMLDGENCRMHARYTGARAN